MASGENYRGMAVRFMQLVSSLAIAAVLGACATSPPPKPPATVASLMSEAEEAIKAGKHEEGVLLLKTAAAAFPADKAPRLRIAQVQFDRRHYGEAISHAQEALERDPNDLVAHSIVAVSGLRVSSKALTDLALKNNLVGNVREEAQSLAKLLRANIGGEIIPLVKPPPRQPKPNAGKPATVTAAQPKPGGDNLADWLNNK